VGLCGSDGGLVRTRRVLGGWAPTGWWGCGRLSTPTFSLPCWRMPNIPVISTWRPNPQGQSATTSMRHRGRWNSPPRPPGPRSESCSTDYPWNPAPSRTIPGSLLRQLACPEARELIASWGWFRAADPLSTECLLSHRPSASAGSGLPMIVMARRLPNALALGSGSPDSRIVRCGRRPGAGSSRRPVP